MFVKCVNDFYSETLTKGRIYEVINMLELGDTLFYLIENDNKTKFYHHCDNFIDVTREIKLEKILKDVC